MGMLREFHDVVVLTNATYSQLNMVEKLINEGGHDNLELSEAILRDANSRLERMAKLGHLEALSKLEDLAAKIIRVEKLLKEKKVSV